MRVLPMGPRAVLLEQLGAEPAAWANGLRALDLEGVVEVVPAATTVLVTCVDERALARARGQLGEVTPRNAALGGRPLLEIEVDYCGEDLQHVADAAGMTVDEVIAAHAAATYVVAFCGFAPGFGYLRGLDPRLHLQRRATPRTRVPPGSVAIAAEYTAVYPRVSPGGWHLLGKTECAMFDPDRSPPALLEPGAEVRFTPA